MSADVASTLGVDRKISKFTPKLKYSLNALDADYMAAVQRGDVEEQQRMVDEAANISLKSSKIRDESGSLIPVYHGTKSDFSIFDTSKQGGVNGTAEGYGIYLTDNPEISAAYGERQIAGYANITKPASASRKTISRRVLAKLADPVTYDDSGNVIPLSQRFNDQNDDIRYSLNARFDESIHLDDQELAIVLSRITQISTGLETDTPRALNGDYIIDINNKLVYAGGDVENPRINRVLQINIDNESVVDMVRAYIYEAEREGDEGDYANGILEAVFGEGAVTERDFRFGRTYAGKNGRGKRGNGSATDKGFGSGNYSINPSVIEDYDREQFVNAASEQIMNGGTRAPALARALAGMEAGAQPAAGRADYAYVPNGGMGGGEYGIGRILTLLAFYGI